MNPERIDSTSKGHVNETELEAATNSNFDTLTQGARNVYKNICKVSENLEDHATIIMTDIFGPNVARAYSRKLEQEASREATASHLQAADHYKRRDLNFSRTSLGEFDPYTVALDKTLNRAPLEEGLKLVDQISVNLRLNQELSKDLFNSKSNTTEAAKELLFPQQTTPDLSTRDLSIKDPSKELLFPQQTIPSLSINLDPIQSIPKMRIQQ